MAGGITDIGRTPDIGRLRDAMGGPGADTRFWCSYGRVLEEPTLETGGMYVSIELVPLGLVVPCRVGAAYSAAGAGVWAPLHKDDEVLVTLPSGDFDEGPVVTARMANALDTMPPEFDNKNLVVKQVAGQDILVLTDSGGKVILGSAQATSHAVKHEELDAALQANATANVLHTHNVTAIGAPTGPAIAFQAPDISAAKSPSVVVE